MKLVVIAANLLGTLLLSGAQASAPVLRQDVFFVYPARCIEEVTKQRITTFWVPVDENKKLHPEAGHVTGVGLKYIDDCKEAEWRVVTRKPR